MRANNDKTHLENMRIALAVLGLLVAVFGSRLVPEFHAAGNILVWVNRQPVTKEQLAFAEQRLLAGSGSSLTATQRRSVIELLIDEELLLQRARSTGTFGADPAVRKAIVQAVVDRTVADFNRRPVSERQLRRFYEEHQGLFEIPPRVALQVLHFDSQDAAKQAYAAILSGSRFDEVGQSTGATAVAHLPSSPLPPHMLRRYLGNALTATALGLEEGQVSEPVAVKERVYLVRAHSVQRAKIQPFEQVRDRVAAEYEFRGRESALEKEVARLWTRAHIQINEQVAGNYTVPEKYTRDFYSFIGMDSDKSSGGR